jgi:hypothetical protein
VIQIAFAGVSRVIGDQRLQLESVFTAFFSSSGRERTKARVYNLAEPEPHVGKEAVARLCGGFGRCEMLGRV